MPQISLQRINNESHVSLPVNKSLQSKTKAAQKTRIFPSFLCLSCLIYSCQEKAQNSDQNRSICNCEPCSCEDGKLRQDKDE